MRDLKPTVIKISESFRYFKRISSALHTLERGLSAIRPVGGVLSDRVNSNTGVRVLNVGGNWNNGTNAGVAYTNANNDSTNTNNNIGGRLDCASMMFDILYGAVQSICSMRGYDLATRQKTTSNNNYSARNQGKLTKIISAGERRIEVSKLTMEVTLL